MITKSELALKHPDYIQGWRDAEKNIYRMIGEIPKDTNFGEYSAGRLACVLQIKRLHDDG